MKYEGVIYSGGVYSVIIPESAADDPMTLQDEIILELNKKLTQCKMPKSCNECPIEDKCMPERYGTIGCESELFRYFSIKE